MSEHADHDHDHDHPHAEISQTGRPGYYDIMETAVRELLIEKRLIRRRRDPPPDRGARLAHARARRQGGGARLDRSRLQVAAARQRPQRPARNSASASTTTPQLDRAGEHREGSQPDRLHAVLLLSAAGAWAAARLVQAEALPRARRRRAARGARRIRHRSFPTTSRSASATRPRWSAFWCCRCAQREPTTTARSNSPRWSRATR